MNHFSNFRLYSCFFLLTSVFLSSGIANAQELYKTGYIVKMNGDTIRGEIEKENWYNTPLNVNFRGEDGLIKSFSPEDLICFNVEDEKYLSTQTQIETSSRIIEELENNSALNLSEVHIFIKEIVGGPNALFLHRAKSYDYYFLKNDAEILPLHYKKYKVIKDDGSVYLTENNRYQMQLDYVLSEECNLSFDRLRYNGKDIKRALYKYYECVGVNNYDKAESKKGITSAGLIGGISHSFSKHKISAVSNGPGNDLSIENFAKGSHVSNAPVFGVFFEVPLGGRSTMFRTELSYLKYKSEAFEVSSTRFRRVASEMEYENTVIRLAIMARVRPFKNKSFGIHFGPSLSKNSNNRVSEKRELEELLSGNTSNETFIDYENLFDARDIELYRPFAFGLHFSISYKINSYLIDLRLQQSEDIVDFVNVSLNQTDIMLAVQKDLWSW